MMISGDASESVDVDSPSTSARSFKDVDAFPRTMLESVCATPLGNRTRILPGCKSACKKLSSMSILNNVFTPKPASVLFCSLPSISLSASGESK